MQEIYRRGSLVVWAGYTEDGRLALDAQDLGGHPVFDEYEYFIRIDPESFPTLRKALSGGATDDVLELVLTHGAAIVEAGETSWLKDHGIPYQFSNWGH